TKFFTLALFLGGCATSANYEKILNSWVGAYDSQLVSAWGPPQNSYISNDGKRFLEYSSQTNIPFGGYAYLTPQTTHHNGVVNTYNSSSGDSAYAVYSGTSTSYLQKQAPIQNVSLKCITRFSVNSSGIITDWSWQGNNCTAKSADIPETIKANNLTVVNKFKAGDSASLRVEPLGLYKGQSLNSERILLLYKKDKLLIGQADGEWTEITTENGQKGWVKTIMIEPKLN
ncbi:hypothetical protein NP590_15800, partial [Methylomonas sp. SURF-2]